MISLKRPALALGAAALMTVSLTACGGGASGAPKDASKADFCKAYEGDTSDYANLKADDYSKLLDLLSKQADALKKVGTPKGISSDERKGFELEISGVKKLDADDLKKAAANDDDADDIMDKAAGFSDDDVKKVKAFDDYASDLCD